MLFVPRSEQDMLNCNIPRDNEETNNPRGDVVGGVLKGVYKCHVCFDLYDSVPELKSHLLSHATEVKAKGAGSGGALPPPKRDDAVITPRSIQPASTAGTEVTPVITMHRFAAAQVGPPRLPPGFPPGVIQRFGGGHLPPGGVSIFPPAPLNLIHTMIGPQPAVSPFFITPSAVAPPMMPPAIGVPFPPPPPPLLPFPSSSTAQEQPVMSSASSPGPLATSQPTLSSPVSRPASRESLRPLRPAPSQQPPRQSFAPSSSTSGKRNLAHLPRLLPTTSLSTYPCNECGRVYPSENNLRQHVRNMHSPSVYGCIRCVIQGFLSLNSCF